MCSAHCRRPWRFFEPRKIVPLPAIEPTVVPAEFNPAIVMKAVGFALTSAAFPPDEPRINSVNELFPLLMIVAFAAVAALDGRGPSSGMGAPNNV